MNARGNKDSIPIDNNVISKGIAKSSTVSRIRLSARCARGIDVAATAVAAAAAAAAAVAGAIAAL